MLFNSAEFIYLFLPVTLLVFFGLAHWSNRLAASWLTVASLFFYGWWNPAYVGLLLASIFFNYGMGVVLAHESTRPPSDRRSWLLALGVGADLCLLAYYKYTNFFLATTNEALGTTFGISEIILPLGISFFTFTQIAFLVDAWRGIAREFNFIHCGLTALASRFEANGKTRLVTALAPDKSSANHAWLADRSALPASILPNLLAGFEIPDAALHGSWQIAAQGVLALLLREGIAR